MKKRLKYPDRTIVTSFWWYDTDADESSGKPVNQAWSNFINGPEDDIRILRKILKNKFNARIRDCERSALTFIYFDTPEDMIYFMMSYATV